LRVREPPALGFGFLGGLGFWFWFGLVFGFGFWFLVFGFWFLVFGFWFLVFGFGFWVLGFGLDSGSIRARFGLDLGSIRARFGLDFGIHAGSRRWAEPASVAGGAQFAASVRERRRAPFVARAPFAAEGWAVPDATV
jgi:hypothetical protein